VLDATHTLITQTQRAEDNDTGAPTSAVPQWSLLTKHGRLLGLLAQQKDLRIKDIAEQLGTTQRTAQLILGELIDAGLVARTKVGRRNTYRVGPPHGGEARRLVERDLRAIADVLVALAAPTPRASDGPPPADPSGPASAA
jgi:DNA-binding MarR family transcriptional regulator